MSETPWLARSSIDRDSDVNHVSDATEQVVEVTISHLEGHVTDEEGLGGRVDRLVGTIGARLTPCCGSFVCGILYSQATTFEHLLVQGLDSCGGGFEIFKIDISETGNGVSKTLLSGIMILGLPFAQASTVAHESALCDCAKTR